MSNYQKVEKMLYEYRALKIEIKNIEIEIRTIENNIDDIKGVEIKESIGKSNQFNSTVENSLLNKEREIEKLNRIKLNKQMQVERLDNILEILKEDEYKLIELRYFKQLTFNRIAEILYMNEIYLIQKRKKIIEEKLIPLISFM